MAGLAEVAELAHQDRMGGCDEPAAGRNTGVKDPVEQSSLATGSGRQADFLSGISMSSWVSVIL